jgi:hypothetical protein
MPRSKGRPKTGGRTKGSLNKVTHDVRALAEVHSPSAVATLAEIMHDRQAPPAARAMAANMLLDRAHGKAPQAIMPGPTAPVVNQELLRQQLLARIERVARSGDSSLAARFGRLLIEGRAIRREPDEGKGEGTDGGAS